MLHSSLSINTRFLILTERGTRRPSRGSCRLYVVKAVCRVMGSLVLHVLTPKKPLKTIRHGLKKTVMHCRQF